MCGNKLLTCGSSSIIMGDFHYKQFISPISNKLLKVTKSSTEHDDFKNLSIIRRITNYKSFYIIPDEDVSVVNPSDAFYKYLKTLVQQKDISIFNNVPLTTVFIDDGGKEDLHTTINQLYENNFTLWKSYKTILEFIRQITLGIYYLHNKNICHLDIKPENIMVDRKNICFKIIDFGFSSQEPFDDFIQKHKGTPGYFPKHIKDYEITKWFPKINANDTIPVNGIIPFHQDRTLVYKIDSFEFGRTILMVVGSYECNKLYYSCFHICKNYRKIKVNNIIDALTEPDIHKRKTIEYCILNYFSNITMV